MVTRASLFLKDTPKELTGIMPTAGVAVCRPAFLTGTRPHTGPRSHTANGHPPGIFFTGTTEEKSVPE